MTPQEIQTSNAIMELHNQLIELQMEKEKLQIKYDELVEQTVDNRVDFATSQAAGWWQKFMSERESNDRYRKREIELIEVNATLRNFKYGHHALNTLFEDERFNEQWTDLLMLMKMAEPEKYAEYERYKVKCDAADRFI